MSLDTKPRKFQRAPIVTCPAPGYMWVGKTGRWVDPLNMRMDDIHIEDIALALSNICRFTGHSEHHLSVAEHSINVEAKLVMMTRSGYAETVDANARLAALLHDGGEAYLGDVAKPIKDQPMMQPYRDAEDRLMDTINARLGITVTGDLAAQIKAADRAVLLDEWTTNGGVFSASQARHAFLARFNWLIRERAFGR